MPSLALANRLDSAFSLTRDVRSKLRALGFEFMQFGDFGSVTDAAAKFDGSNKYLSAAHNSSLNFGSGSYSVNAWVNLTAQSASYPGLVTKSNGTGWQLLSNSGKIWFEVSAGGFITSNPVGPLLINDGWHMVSLVVDKGAGVVRIYVDAAEVFTSSDPVFLHNTDTTAPVRIGVEYSLSNFLAGSMDSVELTGRAFSAGDVAWRYNSGAGRIYADYSAEEKVGMVSFWNLDEASGTRFDSHGSNHLSDNAGVARTSGIARSKAQVGDEISFAKGTGWTWGEAAVTGGGWAQRPILTQGPNGRLGWYHPQAPGGVKCGLECSVVLSDTVTVMVVYNCLGGESNRRAVQGKFDNWLIGPYNNFHRHYNGNNFVDPLQAPVTRGEYVIACSTLTEHFGTATFEVGEMNDAVEGIAFGVGPGALCTGSAGQYVEQLDGNLLCVLASNSVIPPANRTAARIILADFYGIYHPQAKWITKYSSSQQDAIHAAKLTKEQADAMGGDSTILNWVRRAGENGGRFIGTNTIAAHVAFISNLYSAGLMGGKLKRVNTLAGENIAACLTPIIADAGPAVDTNHNFVAGDYSEATALTGNGFKFLATGVAANAVHTDSSYGIGVVTEQPYGGVHIGQNHGDNPQISLLYGTGRSPSNLTAIDHNAPNAPCHLFLSRTSTTDTRIFVNAVEKSSSGVDAAGFGVTAHEYTVFAWDSSGNEAEAQTIRSYEITQGMTGAEVAAYFSAINSLHVALGRSAL